MVFGRIYTSKAVKGLKRLRVKAPIWALNEICLVPLKKLTISYFWHWILFYQTSGQTSEDDQAQVSTEMANRMSLFYAYPTPMLKTLSDATSKFVSEVCDTGFFCFVSL